MVTAAANQPTRKDAARNRVRLLDAAEQLCATEGLEVTLKHVARQAEVGVGTVHRHFPTEDDLLDAIFADRSTSAADSARAAASDLDGWRGLVRHLEESMRMQAHNCGLRGLVANRSSFAVMRFELTVIASGNGRNAIPVHSAENPRVFCME